MSAQSDRWERARELFHAARGLSREQRVGFLQLACSDSGLRSEVEALLHADDALQAGAGRSFLESLDGPRALALLASEDENNASADPDGLTAGGTLGRYQIVRRLGKGGMGVVCLAHDTRLDRSVALKLLPRHLSLDTTARQRFEEEARAASALDHPHIATVYEIAETDDGRLFIVMGYYEGETLREKLERGPLPIAEAVALAVQVAEGLVAAHDRAIVHRDIKPGNVVVTRDGAAKIVDFGIAKIAGSVLTQTGAALGTVAYMSPEQTRGQAVDARTDLWSLGVVLYEMLAGQRPFRAESEQALIYAIRHDRPEPVRRSRPDVPEELARIVSRCLRKNRDRRYSRAAALLADLRACDTTSGTSTQRSRRTHAGYFGGVLAVVVLSLAGAFADWPGLRARGAVSEPPRAAKLATSRLAVLPLANLSAEADAYLADVLTQELIAQLSQLSDLRVIARSSVMRYKSSPKSAAEIGRELNVGTLLEGSVRRSGDRLRLSVQLVDARTQEHLWSEDYEAEVEDVPRVQSEITRRVAERLNVRMRTEASGPSAGGGTEDAEAYKLYLQGRYLLGNLDEAAAARGRDFFQQALERDPGFARAWSGIADAYAMLALVEGLPAGEAYPRARAAAERALELGPELAEAHAALARVLSLYFWERRAAERHFQRAIELDPSSANAHAHYAEFLRNLGRFGEALAAVEKARELDPLSAFPHVEEGVILYVSRRYDEALDRFQRLLRAAPSFGYTYFYIGLTQAQRGKYAEALAALQTMDPDGRHPGALSIRGMVHAKAGRQVEARQMLAALAELAPEKPVSDLQLAVIHIHLGDHERALTLLEQAAGERTQLMQILKVEPIFDPVRSEPRFRALLERVGLE